jgi:hypothetical protein
MATAMLVNNEKYVGFGFLHLKREYRITKKVRMILISPR